MNECPALNLRNAIVMYHSIQEPRVLLFSDQNCLHTKQGQFKKRIFFIKPLCLGSVFGIDILITVSRAQLAQFAVNTV